jgi:hypothetical protein
MVFSLAPAGAKSFSKSSLTGLCLHMGLRCIRLTSPSVILCCVKLWVVQSKVRSSYSRECRATCDVADPWGCEFVQRTALLPGLDTIRSTKTLGRDKASPDVQGVQPNRLSTENCDTTVCVTNKWRQGSARLHASQVALYRQASIT